MNEKPNLLFLVQLPPPIHGVSMINESLLRSPFIKNSYTIHCVPLSFVKDIKDIGIPSIKKFGFFFNVTFQLIKSLITKKIELVYFTFSPSGLAMYRDFLFVLILKIFRKKVVYHLHGTGIRENENSSNAKRHLYKWAFKNEELIILSQLLAYDVRDVYRETPHILANGIEEVAVQPLSNKSIINFVFLSNLIRSKGIENFLNAIKITKEKGYKFKASIIGGPSHDLSVNDLEVFVKDHQLEDIVSIMGAKHGNDKYRVLGQSDVLVYPTLKDCFPLSILEAMQMRLPIITTPIGAISEIVEDGVNGQVVAINNAPDISKAMIKYIESPELIELHGEASYKRFKTKYTMEKFELNFVNLIDQILIKHGKKSTI